MKSSYKYYYRPATLKIVLIYVFFGSLWIFTTDSLVESIFKDPIIMTKISVLKGLLFIICTSSLLYILISRRMKRILDSERLLYKSQERFRQITQNAEELIWELDREGKYTYVNAVIEKLLGYKPEEVIGKKYFFDFFAPECSDVLKNEIMENAKKRVIFRRLIKTCVHKTGKRITLESNASPILNSRNEVIGYMGTDIDITERNEAELALRESEKKLQTYIGQSPIGIFVFDSKGNAHDCNHATGVMLGYPRKELLSLNVINLFDDDFADDARKGFETLKKDHSISAEIKLLKKDKKLVPVLLNAVQLSNDLFMAYCTDISERKLVEEALAAEQNLFSSLISALPDAVYFKDLDSRFIRINEAAAKSYGLNDPSEAIGKRDSDYFGEVHAAQAFEDERKILLTGIPLINNEEKEDRKDGRVTWVTSTKIPLRDSAGKIMGLMGISRDITEQKNAEVALRESEETFTAFMEHLPVTAFIKDKNCVNLFVNKRMIEVFGAHDWIGKSVFDIFPRAAAEKMIEDDINVIKTGYKRTIEVLYDIKGNLNTYETHKFRIGRLDKEPLLGGFALDITERMQAEKALKESEEKYRQLVEFSPLGVVIHKDAKFVFINKAAATLMGANLPEELLGRNIIDFIHPDYRDLTFNKRNNQLNINEIFPLTEAKILRVDGTSFDVEFMTLPINYKDGLARQVIILDITERKQARLELEAYKLHLEKLVQERTTRLEEVNILLQGEIEKQKEAEEKVRYALEREKELNALKTEFISTASHEFRTPMATILSSAELIERYRNNWDESKFIKHTERIKKSIHDLTKLMDEVLTISQAESKKLKFSPKVTNIKEFCDLIIDEINPLLLESHKLNYNVSISKEEYPVDETLLKYILNNLLSNAIKFSENGGIIDFLVSSNDGNLIFQINDQGIGIPEEDQSRIFEPFDRGSNIGVIRGTGLGMSIVKRSIDIYGGSIYFESKKGVGTKFTVSIPIRNS